MHLSKALRMNSGDVVALVGGGGKTTAMFQLADELAGKMRVLTTTTTRIFAAQINRAPGHVPFDPDRQTIAEILPQLNHCIEAHGQVLLIGQSAPRSGKAFGVPPESVDALAESGQFDIILNEADGSRMRPFKAPAGHEPVIPACTTVVTPVVGLDVLNQPLTDETVHRAALVSRLSGAPLESRVTLDTVAAVLSHPQGGLKNIPGQARLIPLLNKVESRADLTAARRLAGKLLSHPRFDAVAIGAVQTASSPIAEVQGRTAAVVLAAGGSSRFGSPKQLAPWQDCTFIEQVVETALRSPVDQVVVVLGAEIEQSQALLSKYGVEIVLNKKWAEGQSASMQAGLAALPDDISSAIFLLVDLPGVSSDIVTALIQRHRQTLAPIIWPEFEGRRGNPVLFDRSLFPELRQIRGDTGGRPLLRTYSRQAERVAVASPAILQDFDRPEDLENRDQGASIK